MSNFEIVLTKMGFIPSQSSVMSKLNSLGFNRRTSLVELAQKASTRTMLKENY